MRCGDTECTLLSNKWFNISSGNSNNSQHNGTVNFATQNSRSFWLHNNAYNLVILLLALFEHFSHSIRHWNVLSLVPACTNTTAKPKCERKKFHRRTMVLFQRYKDISFCAVWMVTTWHEISFCTRSFSFSIHTTSFGHRIPHTVIFFQLCSQCQQNRRCIRMHILVEFLRKQKLSFIHCHVIRRQIYDYIIFVHRSILNRFESKLKTQL